MKVQVSLLRLGQYLRTAFDLVDEVARLDVKEPNAVDKIAEYASDVIAGRFAVDDVLVRLRTSTVNLVLRPTYEGAVEDQFVGDDEAVVICDRDERRSRQIDESVRLCDLRKPRTDVC